MKKIIIGISGASGSIYAIHLLKTLKNIPNVQTHLVISLWGKKNISVETNYSLKQINKLADFVYNSKDLGAKIASGSTLFDAMIIIPASMKTISAISIGYSDNLINRAADVSLKEHRKLILVPRETPLNAIHLKNMLTLTRLGAEIIPPIPQFYSRPKNIQDIINQETMKLLDRLNIPNNLLKRWEGD